MSVIAEIIDTLENKIEKLFTRMSSLEQINQNLKTELTNTTTIIQNQSREIETLKNLRF